MQCILELPKQTLRKGLEAILRACHSLRLFRRNWVKLIFEGNLHTIPRIQQKLFRAQPSRELGVGIGASAR
jgi:hypothetical protein